jgi:hypothetical protein
MEFVLGVIIILILALIGLIIFNYKLEISTSNIAYIITGLTFGSIIFLMLTYNIHSECSGVMNYNNVSLQMVQTKCFQYLNF